MILSDTSTTRMKLKELFRQSHILASNESENVMARFFEIKSNGYRPVQIERTTLDKILNKYGENGFVKISPYCNTHNKEVNDKNTQDLIRKIKQSGYAYLPVYDGYGDINGMNEDYLPSFLVFNCDANEAPRDFSLLESLALQWCKVHNQNNVLVMSSGKVPECIDKDGNKLNNNQTVNYRDHDCYVNPMPCTLGERMRRWKEVMIWNI